MNKSKRKFVVYAGLGLAAIFLALVGIYVGVLVDIRRLPQYADNDAPIKRDVWDFAMLCVREHGEWPGSMEFGEFSDDAQDPEKCVRVVGDYRYVVNGWVETSDAGGAAVRTNFECYVKYLGNRRWRCDKCEFLDYSAQRTDSR